MIVQPQQTHPQVSLSRVHTVGDRQALRNRQRAQARREQSEGISQSVSSNARRSERLPPNAPDLRDCLNQHRGLEAFRRKVLYHEDIRQENAQPTNCPYIPPEVEVRLAEMEACHEARYNALATRQARAVDAKSDEELEPFAPNISNTLFPKGSKSHTYPHTTGLRTLTVTSAFSTP